MEEITAIAGPAAEQIIDSLSSAGLIVNHGQGVMLTDEAVIRHWGRLREWLKAVRDDRLFAEELERDARRWHSDPDTARLWQKRRLVSAEVLCGREDIRISAKAMVFLQASRRAERRVRTWISIAAAAVALSPVIAGIAYWRAAGAKERGAPENEVPLPVVAREEMRSGEPSRAASAPRATGAPETESDDAGDRIRETRPAADSTARHPKSTPVSTSSGQLTRPPASTSPPSLEPVEKW